MERNIEIPEMIEDIKTRYKHIRPIIRQKDGCPFYLYKLSEEELFNTPFNQLTRHVDYIPVPSNTLYPLVVIEFCHQSGQPTVAEVLEHIPEFLLGKVMAFEILLSPYDYREFVLLYQKWTQDITGSFR